MKSDQKSINTLLYLVVAYWSNTNMMLNYKAINSKRHYLSSVGHWCTPAYPVSDKNSSDADSKHVGVLDLEVDSTELPVTALLDWFHHDAKRPTVDVGRYRHPVCVRHCAGPVDGLWSVWTDRHDVRHVSAFVLVDRLGLVADDWHGRWHNAKR